MSIYVCAHLNSVIKNLVGGHQRLSVLLEQGVEETEVVVIDVDEAREKAICVAMIIHTFPPRKQFFHLCRQKIPFFLRQISHKAAVLSGGSEKILHPSEGTSETAISLFCPLFPFISMLRRGKARKNAV